MPFINSDQTNMVYMINTRITSNLLGYVEGLCCTYHKSRLFFKPSSPLCS